MINHPNPPTSRQIMRTHPFSRNVLQLDAAATAHSIEETIRTQVYKILKRKGAVVAVSGGIDSSVTAALCCRALGPSRILALLLPERDSADESSTLGRLLVEHLGIEAIGEDIAPLLDAAGCYRRRDAAIRSLVPEYKESYKCKVVMSNALQHEGFNLFFLVVESDTGERRTVRLNAEAYREIIAATNMKQRARKFFEYHHADRLEYAVAGTPNRLEYDQGFFVKNGDGAADFKPIAHLYKTQVYQLAEYLAIPEEIRRRPPTTDTFSLEQSQEEFYFSLPYLQMDLCLWGKNHHLPAVEVAPAIGLTADQVERVYADIERKRAATKYLHANALVFERIL
jgi:NAD+ synthase